MRSSAVSNIVAALIVLACIVTIVQIVHSIIIPRVIENIHIMHLNKIVKTFTMLYNLNHVNIELTPPNVPLLPVIPGTLKFTNNVTVNLLLTNVTICRLRMKTLNESLGSIIMLRPFRLEICNIENSSEIEAYMISNLFNITLKREVTITVNSSSSSITFVKVKLILNNACSVSKVISINETECMNVNDMLKKCNVYYNEDGLVVINYSLTGTRLYVNGYLCSKFTNVTYTLHGSLTYIDNYLAYSVEFTPIGIFVRNSWINVPLSTLLVKVSHDKIYAIVINMTSNSDFSVSGVGNVYLTVYRESTDDVVVADNTSLITIKIDEKQDVANRICKKLLFHNINCTVVSNQTVMLRLNKLLIINVINVTLHRLS